MRLIADGAIDRDGVPGLASTLGVTERHLNRVLTADVGAGPLAIARAHRAQMARLLIETTTLKFADVAFAAGFGSVRQFNDTIREVFALSPSDLRSRAKRADGPPPASAAVNLSIRLPYRPPLAADELLGWLTHRSVAGVQWAGENGAIVRTLNLHHGSGVVELEPSAEGSWFNARFTLDDVADLAMAVERCRRLLDLDAAPDVVDRSLADDDLLSPLIDARPGLRVPGSPDGFETAVFAVVGQQISVAAAATLVGRIVGRFGAPIDCRPDVDGQKALAFPTPDALADADFDGLGLTNRRQTTIRAVAVAVADGLLLAPGADRDETRQRLLELHGIGPWTADYLALRALGHPDVLLDTDLVVRQVADRLGVADSLTDRSAEWSPWRSYATHHLWAASQTLDSDPKET